VTNASGAYKLLEDVVSSYAAMTAYSDAGVVTRSSNESGSAFRTHFSTLFKRPSFFRFDFSRPHPYSPLSHIVTRHAIGFDGSAAYSVTKRHEQSTEVRAKTSLDQAVAGATGISSGSAHTIGRLLIAEVTGVSILDLADAQLNDDVALNGVVCYSVAARHPKGGMRELWIEKPTLLIRRVWTKHTEGSSEEARDSVRVNQSIDDASFASGFGDFPS
jgi:hypothetical protein